MTKSTRKYILNGIQRTFDYKSDSDLDEFIIWFFAFIATNLEQWDNFKDGVSDNDNPQMYAQKLLKHFFTTFRVVFSCKTPFKSKKGRVFDSLQRLEVKLGFLQHFAKDVSQDYGGVYDKSTRKYPTSDEGCFAYVCYLIHTDRLPGFQPATQAMYECVRHNLEGGCECCTARSKFQDYKDFVEYLATFKDTGCELSSIPSAETSESVAPATDQTTTEDTAQSPLANTSQADYVSGSFGEQDDFLANIYEQSFLVNTDEKSPFHDNQLTFDANSMNECKNLFESEDDPLSFLK